MIQGYHYDPQLTASVKLVSSNLLNSGRIASPATTLKTTRMTSSWNYRDEIQQTISRLANVCICSVRLFGTNVIEVIIILQEKKRANPDELNMFDRAKLGVERLVEKVGFFGILGSVILSP